MLKVLEPLIAAALETGWATGFGSISDVRIEAMRLGLTEVANRHGNPTMTTLRPVSPKEANPNSLSAQYGRDAQPLHTDGAHLKDPPDLVVLACDDVNLTPTRLWVRKEGRVRYSAPQHVCHGVFLVQNGKESFYSTAYTKGRYRYDPGCMTPCDARSRETVKFFSDAMGRSAEHFWDVAGKLLVIDNRQALHARASASDDPQRTLHRISFHLKGEGK
ncbi:hypothetical protein ACIQJ8_16045 [Streptomyces globisporus]|uniref:TauD/TfdA family dioxygenase n=1 Tax=Streptomyces sp. NBC_00148 TaxID=2903626 RepID=A0AAU1LPX1_9ACTN